MLFGALFSSYILLRENAERAPGRCICSTSSSADQHRRADSFQRHGPLWWASLKMNNFRPTRSFKASPSCAPWLSEHQELRIPRQVNHYEVQLKNGTIADGILTGQQRHKRLVFEAARLWPATPS